MITCYFFRPSYFEPSVELPWKVTLTVEQENVVNHTANGEKLKEISDLYKNILSPTYIIAVRLVNTFETYETLCQKRNNY